MTLNEIVVTENGILCKTEQESIYLDPSSANSNHTIFVSHAHMDHLPSKNNGAALASNETIEIANLRNKKIINHTKSREGYMLVDAGHILGSRGILFNDIFYTGDICTRDRGFLRGARIPKCKTLITECTFGLPEFKFPKINDIRKQADELISKLYDQGIPVVLMGHQLGKAQTITQMFEHWQPLYLHDSVKEMNDLHRSLGVHLPECIEYTKARDKGLLDKKPWIMVAPLLYPKSTFVREIKSRYDAVTIGFTGWAKSTRYPYGRNTDYSFPLSDHCDFDELVDMVKKSQAEQVYAVHGFVDEFTAHLRAIDISAEPLTSTSVFC